MKEVLCLDNGSKFIFAVSNGYDAIQKMLYTLNLKNKDDDAKVELCNGRTWCLEHNGNTYACMI